MRSARPTSRVQTEAASPYSTPLAQASACSSSLNRCTVTTGPKTSLVTISASGPDGTTTVGSYHEPAFLIRAPPVATSPVTEPLATPGWRTMPAPTGSPSPVITLSTPGGRMSAASSASLSAVSGVHSDGFKTTVLPPASAGPIFHAAIISG